MLKRTLPPATAAAARAFRTRRKRAAASFALGTVPVALVTAVVLTLAAATTTPFAALALPATAVLLVGCVGYFLFRSLTLVLKFAAAMGEAAVRAAKPVGNLLLNLCAACMVPAYFVAAFWSRVFWQVGGISGSIIASLGPG